MEAVIFIGLQASGKSSFYIERFFTSHIRISMDLLRTRNREERLLDFCFSTEQRFVVDNTNPSRASRQKYIARAKAANFHIRGYYFQSQVADCLARNQRRENRVPEVAIYSTIKKLERPELEEGFGELKYVRLTESGFVVEEWNDEI